MSRGRKEEEQTQFIQADEENLPPNSILLNVKMSPKLKPPPHLLHIFNTYLKNEEINPSVCEQIDFVEFGQRWLPLFNYGAHEDHREIPIMDWVREVSLNPYRPVRLMKHVDGDYVCIAMIPPIFDNKAKIMRNDDRDYFAQLATRQAHEVSGVRRVRQANGFIERNLTNRIDVHTRVLTDHFHKMNEIFELYGVKREIPDWLVKMSAGELAPTVKDAEQEVQNVPQIGFSDGMLED